MTDSLSTLCTEKCIELAVIIRLTNYVCPHSYQNLRESDNDSTEVSL